MYTSWLEPPEIPISEALQRAVGGHPLVVQALARRGYTGVEAARAFLDAAHYTPTPASELPDLDVAIVRLEAAIRSGEPLLVWGDFDVDGQTATTLLVSALRELDADVDYHIPVRARESHGVSAQVLGQLLDQRPASLLLTCDTGVAAHEAIDYARQRGVDVIVSDHHELLESLPEALAVVNPRRLPAGHPLGTLPGVGVAYKLVEELYLRAGCASGSERFLDLVALGIVADVAAQTGETRCLLQRGLELLRSPARLGLQAIYERAELDARWLTEEHIGFVLAPRLNAIGRLGDANPVVELLTTSDAGRARLLALQIEGLNGRRQLLTSQVMRGALAQIETDPSLLEHSALVLAHPSWPAGVIGIVASRLVERFGLPALLIAAPEGELGRGSARSVEDLDITAAIASQADLLEGFGGHSMAAGFAIRPERIDEFRRGLSRAVGRVGLPPKPALALDGYLPWADLSLDLVADLERLAPFGAGNPPLVLVSCGLRLANHSQVGREGEHLLLTVEDENGLARRVIWWNGADYLGTQRALPEGRFDLAYTARASTFRGQRDVQVQFIDFRLLEEPTGGLETARPHLEIIDLRGQEHPLPALQRLLAEFPAALVWAEADAPDKLRRALASPGEAHVRIEDHRRISPVENLVIWTTPASRADLLAALLAAGPRRVALFAVDPELDEMRTFLERLAGLTRYAIHHKEGLVWLLDLTAAMAHRPLSVRMGLEWLAANGHLFITDEGGGVLRLAAGGAADPALAAALEARLADLLDETRAYRAHFARASGESLLE
ncbi:MAG: single-stranded-DNA-specific exonuclease RecJ [Anaerolineales bacterium]|nr:single-stranded-DNA-specific exonuclease RecJ [Anaerolineales bacterium]